MHIYNNSRWKMKIARLVRISLKKRRKKKTIQMLCKAAWMKRKKRKASLKIPMNKMSLMIVVVLMMLMIPISMDKTIRKKA